MTINDGVGATSDSSQSMRSVLAHHMPALDGLRALAILLVIAHNLGIHSASFPDGMVVKAIRMFTNAGWIGVQLFFVLSGFLITGILVDEKKIPQQTVSRQLKNFYLRRVLRIFPLYYATLIVTLLLLPAFHITPSWLDGPRQHATWYWLLVSNWGYAWYDLGHGLSHFWSLAVEEQFYLVWPLLIIFLSQTTVKRICFLMIAVAIVSRLILVLTMPAFAEHAAYTFTIARIDALAIGALLAFAVRDSRGVAWLEATAPSVLLLGLAFVIFLSIVCHNFMPVVPIERPHDWLAQLNQTITALVSAAILFIAIAPVQERGWRATLQVQVRRALTWPRLRFIGKYSFAIYVFHMPVIHIWYDFSRPFLSANAEGSLPLAVIDMCAVTAISTLLALVSWHLLEQPCLRLKSRLAGRQTMPQASAAG